MARAKKTVAVEEVAVIIEAVDPAPQVEKPEIVIPVVSATPDNTDEIKRLIDEIDAEVVKLGKVGHMHYVELGRQRILTLMSDLKKYL